MKFSLFSTSLPPLRRCTYAGVTDVMHLKSRVIRFNLPMDMIHFSQTNKIDNDSTSNSTKTFNSIMYDTNTQTETEQQEKKATRTLYIVLFAVKLSLTNSKKKNMRKNKWKEAHMKQGKQAKIFHTFKWTMNNSGWCLCLPF